MRRTHLYLYLLPYGLASAYHQRIPATTHAQLGAGQQEFQGTFGTGQGRSHEAIVAVGHRSQPVGSGCGQDQAPDPPALRNSAGKEPDEDPGSGQAGPADAKRNAPACGSDREQWPVFSIDVAEGCVQPFGLVAYPSGRQADEARKPGRERSQAVVADLEADLGYAQVCG